VIPPGFAARVNLTIPATTVLRLADRPGELAGIGSIDPDPGANYTGSLSARGMKPVDPGGRTGGMLALEAMLTLLSRPLGG
jgi:hypothetical protein